MPVESLRLVLGGWGSQWCGGIFTGEHGYLTALPFAQHWVLLWHVPALGGKNKDPTMNFISMFATIPTPQDVSQLIMSATRSYTRAYPISDCIKGFRPSAHQMNSSSSYSFWEKGAVRVPVDGFSGAGYYRTHPYVSVITSQCLMDNIHWHCFFAFGPAFPSSSSGGRNK